jgi:hypothetical protein
MALIALDGTPLLDVNDAHRNVGSEKANTRQRRTASGSAVQRGWKSYSRFGYRAE